MCGWLDVNKTERVAAAKHRKHQSATMALSVLLLISLLTTYSHGYVTEEFVDFLKMRQATISARRANATNLSHPKLSGPRNPYPIPSPPYEETSLKTLCQNQRLDVVFLLDGSKSVKSHNFQKMLNFTSELVGNFQIGPQETQVGVVQYSSCIRPHIWLNNFTDTNQLQTAIAGIDFEAKGTATGRALRFVSNRMFNKKKGARELESGVRRVLVLVTDGRWSIKDDIPGALASLEENQVERFTVGVGRVVKSLDLNTLVSEPKLSHAFHIPSFDELGYVGKKILQTICKKKDCGTGNMPNMPPGKTGFDLIRLTGMDTRLDVSIARGSREQTTAYGIGPQTDVQLSPTSTLFPHNFPDNFAIVATFRMSEEARDQDWILLEFRNPQHTAMFSIRILGEEKKHLHFMMRAYNGETCLYEFHDVSRLFRPGFHKVSLYIENIVATLTIDCHLIGQYLLTSSPYLGDTGGHIMISKHVTGLDSTVIDLEEMLVVCQATYEKDAELFPCCHTNPDQCEPTESSILTPTKAAQPDSTGWRLVQSQTIDIPVVSPLPSPVVDEVVEIVRQKSENVVANNEATVSEEKYRQVGDNGGEASVVGFPRETSSNSRQAGNLTQRRIMKLAGVTPDLSIQEKVDLQQPESVISELENETPHIVRVNSRRRSTSNTQSVTIRGIPRPTISPSTISAPRNSTRLECIPGPRGPIGFRGPKGHHGSNLLGNPGPPGRKGEPGVRGANGARGHQGERGNPGEQGYRGYKGNDGPKGDIGPPGLRGAFGNMGPYGKPGLNGPRGTPGLSGEKGDTGLPGRNGRLGPKGEQGPPGRGSNGGLRGHRGKKGFRGLPGTPGQRGMKGHMGYPGTPGIKGDKGNNGPPGLIGISGPPGKNGEIGDSGARGRKGPRGPKGKQGYSGEKGVRGSPGPRGDQGEPGINGKLGIQGKPGIPGLPGRNGAKGHAGMEGPVGKKGNDGRPGPSGPTGPQGEVGPPGERGLKGERGEKGSRGPMGPSGQHGSKGSKGNKGDHGALGPNGPLGKTGKRGPRGPPRSMKQIEELIKTTIANILPAMLNPIRQQCQRCIPRVMEGKAGPPGQNGDKGLPGLPGENGLQGARGAPGFPGRQGESGIRGPRGDTGDKGDRGHAIPGAQGTAGLPGRRGKPGKVVRGKNGRKGVQGIEGPRGHLGQPGIQGNRGQCEPTDCGALPQYPQSPYEYTDNKGPPSHNGGAANRPPDEQMGVFPTLPGASGPNERLPNLPNVIPAVLEQLKGPLNVHVVNLEQFAQSHESDDLN